MNAVIYARYSDDSQREESIEGQIRECMDYANKEGITVLNSYIDRACSAKTDARPQFQKMINDSKQKLFDAVIVWKLDRFARNRTDSAVYRSILRKNGVKVVSAKENISDGPEGIILEAIIEGMSEYYSADLAVKVTRGMTENALKGKFNGGGCTLGYNIDNEKHFVIDSLTAPVVIEVFKKYADGATIKDIVAELKSRNIHNSRGEAIGYHSVRRMLTNRRYLGEYSFNDTVIPNAFEPIIGQGLFDEVQRRIEKNTSSSARYKATQLYLLSDKLYCGKCSSKMVGECGRSSKGPTYYYYKCSEAKHRRCDKRSVRKQYIEDLVIHQTMQMLGDESLIGRIVDTIFDMQAQKSTMLPLLEKQLAETKKGINNMLNAIQSGILTESTKERLEELEQSKKDTELAILQEKIASPVLTKEQIKFWICKWRNADPNDEKERLSLIDIFVNAVYHYDGELLIIFNHKDGEKTITLDEANASRSSPKKGKSSNTVASGSPIRLANTVFASLNSTRILTVEYITSKVDVGY